MVKAYEPTAKEKELSAMMGGLYEKQQARRKAEMEASKKQVDPVEELKSFLEEQAKRKPVDKGPKGIGMGPNAGQGKTVKEVFLNDFSGESRDNLEMILADQDDALMKIQMALKEDQEKPAGA